MIYVIIQLIKKSKSERERLREISVEPLSKKIIKYKPEVIIGIMCQIKNILKMQLPFLI